MTHKTKDYGIKDVLKRTGVSQKQIRHWEGKGYISLAQRVVSGERSYRRFTLDQVETIGKIKDCLDEGFTLSAAVRKITGKNISKKEGDHNE